MTCTLPLATRLVSWKVSVKPYLIKDPKDLWLCIWSLRIMPNENLIKIFKLISNFNFQVSQFFLSYLLEIHIQDKIKHPLTQTLKSLAGVLYTQWCSQKYNIIFPQNCKRAFMYCTRMYHSDSSSWIDQILWYVRNRTQQMKYWWVNTLLIIFKRLIKLN